MFNVLGLGSSNLSTKFILG